jgi:FixJ family two-component response regulator
MVSIIDDDQLFREATSSFIRSLGLSAATFASAEEFLQSGRVHDAACIISDVQMQGMSGIELQEILVARGERLPIIFVTAFPEMSARQRALAAGALGFFDKPFSEAKMIVCLRQALGDTSI